MKKFLQVCLLSVLLVGASGCSGDNANEDVYKKLEEQGYNIQISYRSQNDYYDINGKCYDYNGEEKACERIRVDLDQTPIINIKQDEDHSIIIGENEDGLFTNVIIGDNFYALREDAEYADIYTGGSSPSWCKYYYKGEESSDKQCSETKKSEADKIKQDYEAFVDGIGLSADTMQEFGTWLRENKLNDLITSLKDRKASQKELTNADIVQMLSTEYTVRKSDDGKPMVLSKDGYKWFSTVTQDDGSVTGVMHFYKIFSGEYSQTKMTIAYTFSSNEYVSINEANTCIYEVTNKKVRDGKTCSEDEIADAESMKFSFEDSIQDMGLTLDEFLNFMETY